MLVGGLLGFVGRTGVRRVEHELPSRRPLPGRPARLTQAQQGLVAGWIETWFL